MLKKRLLSALLAGSLTVSSLFCLRPSATAYAASSIPVTIMQQDNGTVTCGSSSAAEGSTVTIEVSPSGGYSSGGIAVVDAENNTICVTQSNVGEYSFVMPRTEVTVVPVFLAGDAGATNTAAQEDTPQNGTEASIPVAVENGSGGITESVITPDNPSPVNVTPDNTATGNNTAEDPATVDIANQTSSKVVTAADGNLSTGISADSSNNTETKTPAQSADSRTVDSSENQSSSSSLIVPAEKTSANDAEDGNTNDFIGSGSVTVSSESGSHSSGTLIVPGGGSGIVSNVAVIPSENGVAEADMVPTGTVVVPGSSAPQMAFSSSGTQDTKQTTLVSSVAGENKITSSITGITKVPDLLSALIEPVLASSVVGHQTVEKNGVPAEKILSAYVPLILPVQTANDGQVITPENARIISDVKKGNIRVASVDVRFHEGWVPVDGSDSSDNDSENQISVSLRQNTTDAHGKINLTKNDWLIRPGKSLPLNLKATLADEIMIQESPVSIEFVLDWA